MTAWYLALKRCLRPAFLLALVLLFCATYAAGLTGKEAALRPNGFVDEDGSALSEEVCQALEQKGYLRYKDRAVLSAAVECGQLDCGAILLRGLGVQLAENRLDDCVLVLHSPMSFLTELYEAQISAVLFQMTAPLRTAQIAQAAGVELSAQEVAERLAAYEAQGRLFTFQTELVDGKAPTENGYGPRLSRAVAALLLFTILVVEFRRIWASSRRMAAVIGRRAAARAVLLPQLSVTLLLCFLAAAIPLGRFSMLSGLLPFCLCIAALACLPVAQSLLCVLLPCVLLGSLALFPIYLDLCARYPALLPLRLLLPPCWLVLTPEHPLLWGAAGLAALGLSYILFRKRGER